jgi:hypothetical protein
LVGNEAAGLLLPLPDPLDERLPPQIDAVLARRNQLSFHHHLGRDARVIGAGLPQGVETEHSPVADERIHDRVLEGMTHVQGAGDIGRRNDD